MDMVDYGCLNIRVDYQSYPISSQTKGENYEWYHIFMKTTTFYDNFSTLGLEVGDHTYGSIVSTPNFIENIGHSIGLGIVPFIYWQITKIICHFKFDPLLHKYVPTWSTISCTQNLIAHLWIFENIYIATWVYYIGQFLYFLITFILNIHIMWEYTLNHINHELHPRVTQNRLSCI